MRKKNIEPSAQWRQNFTAKFSCRIIARARVHYLPRNFEVVKLTQVNTLHGPARRGACELSNAILRRDRLLVNGAATAFYFQRNVVYVYVMNKFVRMRETVYNLISLSHKPRYIACKDAPEIEEKNDMKAL